MPDSRLVVGKSTVISPGFRITPKGGSKPVLIGNDVYIGPNTIIQEGMTIGNGAIILSDSCKIDFHIPAYAFVQNGQVMGFRYSRQVIDFLQEIEWWNWSGEIREKNDWFFKLDLSKFGTSRQIFSPQPNSTRSLQDVYAKLVLE